jgi:hypothetical protein
MKYSPVGVGKCGMKKVESLGTSESNGPCFGKGVAYFEPSKQTNQKNEIKDSL